MNATQLGVIALLKSAITEKAETLPEQFDIEQAYPILRRHGVTAMGYVGALYCGIPKELPAMQKLRMDYYAATLKSEGQMAAVKEICQAFDSNGIDYMLLKGCNMKPLYPRHELRSMGDADILIRMEQYAKTRVIMQGLGFVGEEETDHEIIWRSKGLYLELHKRLMPTGNHDYYRYYGDGWKVAQRQQNNAYAMTKEDQFIYLFTHFAKHYRSGGIGCRHVVDLWVYLRCYPNMDTAYIRRELQTLALVEFYDNMMQVIAAWFQDSVWNERTEIISQVIFASGNWGSAKSHALSQIIRGRKKSDSALGGKLRWFFRRAFLSLKQMSFRYPVLKKWPVLLPVFWVVRWIYTILFEHDKFIRRCRTLTKTSAQEIETHEQALSFVGLRFEK